MQIKTLKELQSHVSFIKYKGQMEMALHRYKVYICQPINYIDEGLKHLDIWSGYIIFITNAISRTVGTFMFHLDKKQDETYLKKVKENIMYTKLSPMGVNTLLGKIQSEANCKAFPNLKRSELFLTDKNKALFTSKEEAEQYIQDIKDGKIKIPAIEHIITVTTTTTDSSGNKTEEIKEIHLPRKNNS